MKFTISWLKQYTDFDLETDELAERLTMAGLEVETVDELFHDLHQVRIAEVVDVKKHPDADRLSLCRVNVCGEKRDVVCGAPNVRPGLFAALALPGAQLPSGLTVKESKIRGVLSQGMLCSEKDLGISEDHSGIMELTGEWESGQELAEALELKDTLIEVDLTPNRPDCTSVIGIAREVAAFAGGKLRPPVKHTIIPELAEGHERFSVKVEAPDHCPRYAARLVENVQIGPSPWWLKKRLLSVGLRPINNVVDITNFIMLEYGQPLHAFDFRKLSGGGIVVRKAQPGEGITTLDGENRKLDPEMLMICDLDRPVAVAGIMGGEDSEVGPETVDVLIEAACFNPLSIRRTSRILNLSTDSAYRFERGVDPELAPIAMERAVQLMTALADAELVPGGVDIYRPSEGSQSLSLRVSKTREILGLDFTAREISELLSSIEIDVENVDGENLLVTPPSFRVDLEREVDLIEEVARLKGYNRFPHTLPMVPMSRAYLDDARSFRKKVSALVNASGFDEAINYSFISPRHFDMLNLPEVSPFRKTIAIQNPLTDDQSVMRTTLLPGLLENIRHNINHQITDIRLFEIGKVFSPKSGQELPLETFRLTLLCSGARFPEAPPLYFSEQQVDIFDIKGVAEVLLQELRRTGVKFEVAGDSAAAYSQPSLYMQLTEGGRVIGELGAVSPSTLEKFSIKQEVFYLDIDLDLLYQTDSRPRQFEPLNRYPAVKRDLAVLVPVNTGAGEIIGELLSVNKEKLIEDAELFDVYEGKPVQEGFKSVAVSMTYRSSEHTLSDKEVNKVHQKITDRILDRFGGRLRE